MLQIKNLSKSYGAKKAVSNLSFVVEDGDIMGFIGKNGAGKSTLFNLISGRFAPTSGEVLLHGERIDGKKPFRENKELQKQLLKLMKKYPYMAHNAAFEDSWFKIHLDGYAEARRAGKIIVIDSRQICRSLDADVRSLPRESAPAALENWARRRGTLAADANEQHLGLDDTDLMLRTVQAEFNLKNLFAK